MALLPGVAQRASQTSQVNARDVRHVLARCRLRSSYPIFDQPALCLQLWSWCRRPRRAACKTSELAICHHNTSAALSSFWGWASPGQRWPVLEHLRSGLWPLRDVVRPRGRVRLSWGCSWWGRPTSAAWSLRLPSLWLAVPGSSVRTCGLACWTCTCPSCCLPLPGIR